MSDEDNDKEISKPVKPVEPKFTIETLRKHSTVLFDCSLAMFEGLLAETGLKDEDVITKSDFASRLKKFLERPVIN